MFWRTELALGTSSYLANMPTTPGPQSITLFVYDASAKATLFWCCCKYLTLEQDTYVMKA